MAGLAKNYLYTYNRSEMKFLYIVLVVALLGLTGCATQQKAGKPVYDGPFPLENFKGPGDYLWEHITEK